jgi:hypothetical protein
VFLLLLLAVDAVYINKEELEEKMLSQLTVIAVAVSSGVAGVAVVVAWVAVILCCCVLRNSKTLHLPPEDKHE